MITDAHVTALETMIRESGTDAVLLADQILDAPLADRPAMVGQAIARFGRQNEFVRVLARGCDLPGWLTGERELRTKALQAMPT